MLEIVINARLQLQSTQKALARLLNLNINSIKDLKSDKFLSKFNRLFVNEINHITTKLPPVNQITHTIQRDGWIFSFYLFYQMN